MRFQGVCYNTQLLGLRCDVRPRCPYLLLSCHHEPALKSYLETVKLNQCRKCYCANIAPRLKKAGIIADLIPDPRVTEVTRNMKEASWTARILVRYILLQVPGTALLVLILIQLRNWFDLPAWSVWGLVAISVAKDVILFPFVWSAYDWDRQGEANSMVGRRGIVKERLAPSGLIQIRGELWKAKVVGGSPPIEKGKTVRVEEMRGLTLLVRPYKEENNE